MVAQAIIPSVQPKLTIEKGINEYNAEIKKLTNTAWQIAYTALWNTLEFSAQEKETAINFISGFLQQGSSHKKAYTEFIQRVLLARQYVSTHPGTWIPIPSQWFNTENKKGFAGTKQWFDTVQNTRASLPQYKITLKAFAEAVHETVETGKATDFHYWRSYFIQHNCHGLLNLFLSTIANCNNNAV
jgi:hypothetical protein